MIKDCLHLSFSFSSFLLGVVALLFDGKAFGRRRESTIVLAADLLEIREGFFIEVCGIEAKDLSLWRFLFVFVLIDDQ